MKFLQELTNLFEAEVPGVNHVDIEDLIKHFPNNHKKAIEKLWGGDRLTWNGISFHSDGGIYDGKLDKAADSWGKNGGELHVEVSDIPFTTEDGETKSIEVNFEQPINPSKDGQEVYMGIDPQTGDLYVGYDIWSNEEDFSAEWDKAFENETGEVFDYDNPAHAKAYTAAHKEITSGGNWMLFKLEKDGDDFSFELEDEGGDGTFYSSKGRGGHTQAKNMGLIDLRLD